MPNIRESLYQCLANEITVTSTSAIIELCTTESNAYAITIYVVYNGTSFLELNLNSGTIRSGDKMVGYYRIRQAALQPGENNGLYLNNKTYYLYLNQLTQNSKIYIRKELKFGTYNKLLSSIYIAQPSENDLISLETSKLTSIKYDTYRNNDAYSNGYFVETQDHTYVQCLAVKTTSGSKLGDDNNPFESGYIKNVTATSILVTSIGNEADTQNNIEANKVNNISAATVNADTVNIRSFTDEQDVKHYGTINLENIEFGVSQLPVTTVSGVPGNAEKSGFDALGRPEFRYVDSNHMYTTYAELQSDPSDPLTKYYAQQLVVPGGIIMSNGSGEFAKASVGNMLTLGYLSPALNKPSSDTANTEDPVYNTDGFNLYIDRSGVVSTHYIATHSVDMTGSRIDGHSSNDTLIFISDITQNPVNGDVTYYTKHLKFTDSYSPDGEDAQLPISSIGVEDAINNTLNITDITNTVGKTITKITESAGIIGAKFDNIILYDNDNDNDYSKNQIWVFLEDNNPGSAKAWRRLTSALDLYARANHVHGNITNLGEITSTAINAGASLAGAQLLIRDNSDVIQAAHIQFDGSTTNQYLAPDGDWHNVPTRLSLRAEADDHVHGNLDHDGKISSAVDISTNDAISIITDNNDKLSRSKLTFDSTINNYYLSRNGTWTEITLNSLGGADADHNHNKNYVLYSAAQTLLDTEKAQARANIGAGIIESVTISEGTGITVQTTGSTSTDPLFTISLNGGFTGGTINGSSGEISYNDEYGSGGHIIQIPSFDYDDYGRVVQNNEKTNALIPGHTVDYSIDEDGVLTLTFL